MLLRPKACMHLLCFFFFSSRRRHTRFDCDWSSDVCSSDLLRARKVREDKPFALMVSDIGVVRELCEVSDHEAVLLSGYRRPVVLLRRRAGAADRKSTRLNSSHSQISYAVFCLKKKSVNRAVRAAPIAHASATRIIRLLTGAGG